MLLPVALSLYASARIQPPPPRSGLLGMCPPPTLGGIGQLPSYVGMAATTIVVFRSPPRGAVGAMRASVAVVDVGERES
jgi:hypothetical protein